MLARLHILCPGIAVLRTVGKNMSKSCLGLFARCQAVWDTFFHPSCQFEAQALHTFLPTR